MSVELGSRRGVIAYYRRRADEAFWSEHWSAQSFNHLLRVAELSALTRFLEQYIHPGMKMLEAGCGLGQYVRYFAERGVHATGVDFSREAVDEHRRLFPDSEIYVADLASLPFPDSSFDSYVSLGVIEHYHDGGRRILAEARRVLASDGLVLLSVPYANWTRRRLRRRIEQSQDRVRLAGGAFYQYALDESVLDELLASAGFVVVDRSYYDPGRGLRDLRGLLRPAKHSAAATGRIPDPRAQVTVKRMLVYTRPMLKLLAHMQVVCARVT